MCNYLINFSTSLLGALLQLGALSVRLVRLRMRKKYQSYSLVNLTLNMRYKNDKKYQIYHHHIRFFKLKMHQSVPGPAPDPAGRAYDAPPDSLVG